jgi:DNA-binding MarR family transcriptional regulator
MVGQDGPDRLPHVLREATLAMIRRDDTDLSARQLAVVLTVYLTEGPHTVRGLAAELHVSKPAITRALDRLGEFGLAQRQVDEMDRRSVIFQRTQAGEGFVQGLRAIMRTASIDAARSDQSEPCTGRVTC